MPKARSNRSKPSPAYAKNFAAVFGDKPRRPRKKRSFLVLNPKTKKWVPIESLPVSTRGLALWPRYSDTMSIHPSQAAEVNALLRRKGVKPVEFDKLGRPKLESKAHEKAYARARGFCSLDAGCGDAVPLHYQGPGLITS